VETCTGLTFDYGGGLTPHHDGTAIKQEILVLRPNQFVWRPSMRGLITARGKGYCHWHVKLQSHTASLL
jgi:hypothetical protein